MSCDWCEGPIQQQRGRPRHRSTQGGSRRHGTASPPKFSTNSAKPVICAPYYSNKVAKRAILNSEVRDYNKSFAGKSAAVAVQSLCGDWYQSPAASVYSSTCSTLNDTATYDDDVSNQAALSAAVQEDITLIQNLYGGQASVVVQGIETDQSLQACTAAQVDEPLARNNIALPQAVQCNFSFPATRFGGAGMSYAAQQLPEFWFPPQAMHDVPTLTNPLASVHLWPNTADSVLGADPSASIFSRPGHICEALASYSQMFSASWMPQLAPVPASVPELTAMVSEQGQNGNSAQEYANDEDFEHLSQMSEQDWFDMQQVVEDDYVLV